MAVGDKTPKESPVKVFQFASKFVGYNHFASVLRVKDAYFQVQWHFALPDWNVFQFLTFQYGLHGEISSYSLFNISAKTRLNFKQNLSFER